MKDLYISDCVNVYTDESEGMRTVQQACDPANCTQYRGNKTITDLPHFGTCPNYVENFQIFSKKQQK